LQEARLMQQKGHWNACANRLYYAAFYAISALLVKDGHVASKHSGIKALFNRHYVKTGIFEKEDGRFYSYLFNLRQEGDYIDFVVLDANTVEPLIESTDVFIKKIQTTINAA
jgi:uncharacterized protein